jgi:hypothetical protein
MQQRTCGRLAAAFAVGFVAATPALAMDRAPADRSAADVGGSVTLVARPCPTRFDYLVLASFADAPGLLSLSRYQFRGDTGFSATAATGWVRVAYEVASESGDCRSRYSNRQSG